MNLSNNNLEAAFRQYLETTPWTAYEDHYDTAEYIPALLLELHSGPDAEKEKEILGELFSRIYHQEGLSTAIRVTIYPLLVLCVLHKIQSKEMVLEFILEIEQRYLYLKGTMGVMPYKYAYLGALYHSDEAAAKAIEESEKPYYELIQQQRELLVALFKNQDPLVQNLAIKAYGLTALLTNTETPVLSVDPLLQQLDDEYTIGNTLVVLGMVAQLSRLQTSIPETLQARSNYQQHIAVGEGLAGMASPKTLELLEKIDARVTNYSLLPWYRGDLHLLALAALANSAKNAPAITNYLFNELRKLKKLPMAIPHAAWKTYEIAAEFIASAYFSSLMPAAHKRGNDELTPEQLVIVKKLSGELKIITSIQVLAGLPETIKEVNRFAGLAQ